MKPTSIILFDKEFELICPEEIVIEIEGYGFNVADIGNEIQKNAEKFEEISDGDEEILFVTDDFSIVAIKREREIELIHFIQSSHAL